MREIQCSNVSGVVNHGAGFRARAVGTALGAGAMTGEAGGRWAGHRACLCVDRGSGCPGSDTPSGARSRSDWGICWSFPETLWSVPTGARASGDLFMSFCGGPGVRPTPQQRWPPHLGGDPRRARGRGDRASRRWRWHLLGKAISRQPKAEIAQKW